MPRQDGVVFLFVNADKCKKIYNAFIESNACDVCREVKVILESIRIASNIDTDQIFDIKVILSELLQNAIKHGNEYDVTKKIHVGVWMNESSDILEINVIDQGCGFDPVDLDLDRMSDNDPMNICESGRGLFIVQSLSDFMEFNELGNGITVKKKLNII
jgi:serine/threonine-protein kinase RsbW